MLERAKEVTRNGRWTAIEYARFADDLVILVDSHPRHRWLRQAVGEETSRGTGQAASGGKRREEPSSGPDERRELRIPWL